MPIISLDHVQLAMPAGGEARARAFYATLLGIPEVPKPAHLAARGGCWFERGSVRVHLGVDKNFRPARKAHPAFTTAELGGLAGRLMAVGAAVEWDEAIPELRRFYTADAVGNRLEFMEEPR